MSGKYNTQGFGRPIGLSGSLAMLRYYSGMTHAHQQMRARHTAAPAYLSAPADNEKSTSQPNTTPGDPAPSTPPPASAAQAAREDITTVPDETGHPAPPESGPDRHEHAPRSLRRFHRPLPPETGLLAYKKWWMRRESDLSVNGETVTGVPVFVKSGILRVINAAHSYYIPLEKIDFIRTNDGLETSFTGGTT